MGLPLCASLPVSEVSWSSACIETTPTSRQRYDLKKVKINLLHEFMQEFERRFQEIIFFPIFLSCQNGSNGKCTSLICKVEGSWRVRFYLFLTPSLKDLLWIKSNTKWQHQSDSLNVSLWFQWFYCENQGF